MKFIVFAIVLIALIWIVGSPWLAVNGLRDAAEDGDPVRIDRYVDFPAVRENLKTDLKSRAMAELDERSDNPLAALGVLLGGAVIDRVVDAFVSPSGIAAASKGRKPDLEIETSSSRSGEASDFDIDREGLNTFIVRFEGGAHDAPELVFSRRGLKWELTRIDVSDAF